MAVWQLLLFLEAVAAVFYQISPLLYFCHISYPLCLGSSSCLFLHLFLSVFVKQLLLFFYQIFPLLSPPLFCRWWNCLSPYIIWNMSWWSRTCEELGIISSRPYITFSSLLCYDATMLKVYDQMMINMFLRPLFCCLPLLLWIWKILLFNPLTLSNMLSYHHSPFSILTSMIW